MTKIFKKGPFKGLKKRYYKVLAIDIPWTYETYSAKGKDRSPEKHYNCMTLDEIKALPVKKLAAKDCVIFLWVIDTHLPMALDVLKAWGFTYKTIAFYWAKTNKDGTPFTGMGHWTRANPEQCWLVVDGEAAEEGHQALLATTGSPKRLAKNVKRLIMSQRREHSRKPDEFFERVEALVEGPYLELFGRQSREGWTVWGAESNKFDDPVVDDLDDILGDLPRKVSTV